MADEQQQPVFSIEKLYIRDLSLEVPNAPQVFLERESPQIEVQLQTAAQPIAEAMFDATLTVTVTARLGDRTLFLVEVKQSGIFQIRNLPQEDLEPVLGVACPNILFPYAREVVSDVVTRAGFPPVVLNPINFEAMYMQQRQAQQVQGTA